MEIKPWKLESDDTQLLDLIPFLECKHWELYLFHPNRLFHLSSSLFFFHFCNIYKHKKSVDVAMARPSDIRAVLASYQSGDIAAEFIERSKEHQRSVDIFVCCITYFYT